MDSFANGMWQLASTVFHVSGAVAVTTVAAWQLGQRDRFGGAGKAIVAGLAVTASWCLAVAVWGGTSPAASLAETLRNLAWLLAIYQLFAGDGRHTSLAPIRPVVAVLALVELLHLGVVVMTAQVPTTGQAAANIFEASILLRMLMAIGALVLVHNLFAGASAPSRIALRWPAAGLALLWAYELNLFTIAYLSGSWPAELAALRGLAVTALAGLIAIGVVKGFDTLRFRPSRAVAFQTFSLLVIGLYLVGMVAIANWLSFAGGDFAPMIELGFLLVASVLALLVLPSARMRGWIRVTLAKHLFQHRYDYRAEWLRFTRTIGNNGAEAMPLGERVVQAIADIAESPGGLLLTPGDHGDLILAAHWQWPNADVPAVAMAAGDAAYFEREGFIADLDDIRARRAAAAHVPDWLLEETRAWALVPLIHFEQLAGLVVLARPPAARKLDWEDFDLLRVVGRQLASYLAEHSGQEALAEASRFDDFHRRIAFVMHDIKNLASQLSLLARNAELHADKPAFRDDMLVTLRNSADKLNALLARLGRYGTGGADRLGEVSATDVAKAAVARFAAGQQVVLAECQDCTVAANRDSLEQALVHLIQNGLDASASDASVFLSVSSDGLHARFEVIDAGSGMSPEFVRTRLFKPFVSTKPGGFGIGAFEARELVRAMNGRLDVESREGLGSRFIVQLPLAEASDLYKNLTDRAQKAAS